MAIFDDGTPLDAAALQDLDRRLTEIKASIPRIGSSTENSGVQNQLVVQKQMIGGLSGKVPLTPGKATPFTINWGTTLESTPKAVVLTPVRSADIPSVFSFAVDNKTLSATGVQGNAYLNSAAKGPFNIYFYWMVICH